MQSIIQGDWISDVCSSDLPGIILAALATLGLGAVLGPEAPLIAIGGGLGALTVRLVRKDAPPMALMIMASAGRFAAISTLLEIGRASCRACIQCSAVGSR